MADIIPLMWERALPSNHRIKSTLMVTGYFEQKKSNSHVDCTSRGSEH